MRARAPADAPGGEEYERGEPADAKRRPASAPCARVLQVRLLIPRERAEQPIDFLGRVVEVRRHAQAVTAGAAARRHANPVAFVQRWRRACACRATRAANDDDGCRTLGRRRWSRVLMPSSFAEARHQLLRERLRALLDRRATDLRLEGERLAQRRSSSLRRAGRRLRSGARCRRRRDRRCTTRARCDRSTRSWTNSTPHSRAPHGHLCALPE